MKNGVFFLANRQVWAAYCLVFGLVLLGTVQVNGATKTWGGATTGAWTTGSNWVGGVAPVTNDDVVIGGSSAITINNVPNITLRSLQIQNTSTAGVTLSQTSTVLITVNKPTSSGTALICGNLSTSRVSITVAAGSTGTIGSGKVLSMGTSSTLTVSGTITATGSSNSPIAAASGYPVIINSGGLINYGGSSARGVTTSTAGITVKYGGELRFSGTGTVGIYYCTIENGGLLTLGGSVTTSNTSFPTYRTGSTLQYAGTSAQTANYYEFGTVDPTNLTIANSWGVTFNTSVAPNPVIEGTLTLTSGTLKLTGTNYPYITFQNGHIPIVRGTGNIDMGTTGALYFGKTGNMAGNAFTLPDNLFTGSLTMYRLEVNRNNALTLNNQNLTISTFCYLYAGIVNLGSGNLTIEASSVNTSGSFSSSKMFVTSSTSGYLRHTFPVAGASFTFPIGDNVGTAEYSPIDLAVSSTSVDRTIGFRVVDANHPSLNLPSAPANSLSRYWETTLSTSTGNYYYDLDMNYVDADVNGSNEANIAPVAWDGSQPWNQYPSSINTSSNILSIESANSASAPLGLPLTGREGAVGPNLIVNASVANASATACLSTSMDYLVDVKNNGNQDIAPGTTITVSAYTNSLTCGGTAVATQNFNTGLASNATETLTFSLPNIGNGEVSFQVDPSNTIAEINDGDNCLSDNTVTVTTSLSGTYTIGGSSPDYATFTAAVADLNSKGVCGPVVFNVRQGSYTEQITINSITGSSATNTVTFQADPANTTAAILTYGAQGSSNNHVVAINGASYLRFYNLTISNTNAGTTYKRVVELKGATNDIVFDGNSLLSGAATGNGTSTTVFLVDALLTSVNSNNTITNNTITGGGNGIDITATSSNPDTGTRIEGNTISGFNSEGISMSYQSDLIIRNNTISSNSTQAARGIDLANISNGLQVTGNTVEIIGTNAKVALYISSVSGTSGNRAIVANNFLSVEGTTTGVNAIYAGANNYVDYVFNNLYGYGTGTSNETFNLNGGTFVRIYNNNVVATGAGFAFYTSNTSFIEASNYNNFYTTTSSYLYGGGVRADLAAWQTASGLDANSVSLDPQYVSLSSPYDLHVNNGALSGTGTAYSGISTDIDGDVRAAAPTIGADEFAAPVTETVWTGSISTDWFDSNNWTAGIPTVSVDAIIPDVSSASNRYPVLVSVGGLFGVAKDLNIHAGASVSLPNSTRIELSRDLNNAGSANFGLGTLRFTNANTHIINGDVNIGTLTLNAATTLIGTANITEALNLVAGDLNTTNGTLTLKSDATQTAYLNDFASGYTGTLTGNITVERFVSNTVGGFHYVGAPVGGATIADWGNEFSTAGPNNIFVTPQPTCNPNGLANGSAYGGLFDYRESNVTTCYQSGWRVRSSGALAATDGYAGVIPNNTTINLAGSANTGNINSDTLTRTPANGTSTQGMHLVSNPYPSALDWYEVSAGNTDLDGTAYLWLTSGGYQGTYQPINAITPGSSFIGASQGYFVEALANGAVLNYNNTMRVASNNAFARQGQAFDSRLILEVSGNGYNDRTIVAFGTDFTHGYDREYDGKKMQSKGGVMTLYTTANSNYPRQATNALPNDRSVKVVPVGFAAGADGTFTFNATDLGTFPVGTMIYLEDKKTNTFTNLTATPTYTFNGGKNDAEDRFLLHFIPGIEWSVAGATCMGNDGSLELDLGESEMGGTIITWDTYEIVNQTGTEVIAGTNANGTINLGQLSPGTYTVTLEHDGYTVTQDITITGVPVVDAAATVSDNSVTEGEVISFGNNSFGATTYTWDFGDGNTSTDAAPAYSYTEAGIYVVTLTATNGTCTDVYTQTIKVSKQQGPTGIDNVDATKGIRIYSFERTITVRFDNYKDKQVQLDLYDLTGRKVIDTRTLNTTQAQHNIAVKEVVTGYYFVRVQGTSGATTQRVFLGE